MSARQLATRFLVLMMKIPKLQWPETLATTNNLTMALKVATIAFAVIAVYYQDLGLVFGDAILNEATNYLLAVPPLFAYLIYRKRKMLKASITEWTPGASEMTRRLTVLCGALLCALGSLIYWQGSTTFVPLEYHLVTLPIFAAGLTLVLFNFQTLRQAAFPVAFLVFLTPPSSQILNNFGATLSRTSSQASTAIGNLLGVGSRVLAGNGNAMITVSRPDQTTASFIVDTSCSGVYVLVSFVVFATFIMYVTRGKMWKRAVLFLFGLPLMILLNIVRMAAIILIAYYYGEQLALQAFHFLGGWIILLVGTIVLVIATERILKIRVFSRTLTVQPCQQCESKTADQSLHSCPFCGRLLKHPHAKLRKSDVAKIAAVILLVGILLSVQTPSSILDRGPAQILIQTASGEKGNTMILPQVQNYTLRFVMRDKHFEQMSRQDLSLIYAYESPDRSSETVWVGVEVASTLGPLHNWETCLITWPIREGLEPQVTQLDLRDVQLLQNPPLTARYFAFEYKDFNQTQIVLYWFETSVFAINGTSRQEHVKLSLATYYYAAMNLTDEENKLLTFATAIAENWEPMKTWTQAALFLSQNGDGLAIAAIGLLVAIIVYQVFAKRRTRKNNELVCKKLSSADQQLISAVSQTEKAAEPTARNILQTYRNTTGLTLEIDDAVQRLVSLEKTGLVKSQMISQQDNPIQIWRANLNTGSTRE